MKGRDVGVELGAAPEVFDATPSEVEAAWAEPGALAAPDCAVALGALAGAPSLGAPELDTPDAPAESAAGPSPTPGHPLATTVPLGRLLGAGMESNPSFLPIRYGSTGAGPVTPSAGGTVECVVRVGSLDA